MIIGCYYGDGSPVEEVNLHDKGRIFELEACVATIRQNVRFKLVYFKNN